MKWSREASAQSGKPLGMLGAIAVNVLNHNHEVRQLAGKIACEELGQGVILADLPPRPSLGAQVRTLFKPHVSPSTAPSESAKVGPRPR